MRVLATDILGAPVRTESGDMLGKLADLVLDADGLAATHICVAKSSLIAKILPSEFRIHVGEIVSVSKEVIVVRDAAAEEASARSAIAAAERAAAGMPVGEATGVSRRG